MKDKILYACLGFFVCLATVMSVGRWTPTQPAYAQGMVGAAGAATVVMGEITGGEMPIIVLDSVDNSLMLYKVDMSRREWTLELQNARTYRYDKQLHNLRSEPSVEDIIRRLERQERRTGAP